MPTALIEELDRLYVARSDDARTIHASVTFIEQHLLIERHAEANAYELLWRLSRARFFLGQCAEGEPRTAREHHQAGAIAGKLSTRVAPNGVEGRFWQGVNLALRAQAESAWRALPMALTARRALQRAVRINHLYHDAGALRVLARLESKLPPPFGSSRRAAQLFTRAIEVAPTNTVTRRYFAEHLLERGDTVTALEHLRAIRDAPQNARWEYETTRDKLYSEEMLRNLRAF
jgi:tetratricopeptide (TPR) repeat protein